MGGGPESQTNTWNLVRKTSHFFKKTKFSKQPKKQNKLDFYFSLSGVPNVRGGWVGSDVWDKVPNKSGFFYTFPDASLTKSQLLNPLLRVRAIVIMIMRLLVMMAMQIRVIIIRRRMRSCYLKPLTIPFRPFHCSIASDSEFIVLDQTQTGSTITVRHI